MGRRKKDAFCKDTLTSTTQESRKGTVRFDVCKTSFYLYAPVHPQLLSLQTIDPLIFISPESFEIFGYYKMFVPLANGFLPVLPRHTFCSVGIAVAVTAVVMGLCPDAFRCSFCLPLIRLYDMLPIMSYVKITLLIVLHVFPSADLLFQLFRSSLLIICRLYECFYPPFPPDILGSLHFHTPHRQQAFLNLSVRTVSICSTNGFKGGVSVGF